ncbi:Hypothetical predicted protein [Olea europaea subsp. europaea]|uniref:Uncharacterized protein n=2 Tax=Olea europaea subsp. europaea TaxID=158383 RepID=A0A8S0SBY1_OLEEU|nr:Hypothetical predicted protein [Olea europaea subsp. europaea]
MNMILKETWSFIRAVERKATRNQYYDKWPPMTEVVSVENWPTIIALSIGLENNFVSLRRIVLQTRLPARCSIECLSQKFPHFYGCSNYATFCNLQQRSTRQSLTRMPPAAHHRLRRQLRTS